MAENEDTTVTRYTPRNTYPYNPVQGGMDASEMLKTLLNNDYIPQPIKQQFQILFPCWSDVAKLTFVTDAEIRDLLLEYELMRINILKSIPKNQCTPEVKNALRALRMILKMNLYQSRGKGVNFVQLISSSVHATFAERPIPQQHSENTGWAARTANAIKKAFGGGE